MDFTKKARWVLDGHRTSDPEGSIYAGVVSRDSVKIGFTYATLNDLEVCAVDIRNVYLQPYHHKGTSLFVVLNLALRT